MQASWLKSEADDRRIGMADRVRAFDWSKTPLGPMDQWPKSLWTAIGICLKGQLPMFVWWGPDLINIYNDAYAPVLGNRHPSALGRPAREVWADIWPQIGDDVEAVVRRGVPVVKERVRFVMERNGYPEETYFTYSHSPIPDDEGGIGGLFQVCTDETARVRAEAAMIAAEQRWELAVRGTNDGVWDWNPVTDELYWSPRCKEMLGYAEHELEVSRDVVRGLMHPDDRENGWAETQRHLAGETPHFVTEYRLRHRDGSYRWVLARGVAVRNAAGDAVRMAGSHTDITKRRATEESLRRTTARLQLAVEVLELGTWSLDLTDNTVEESDRFIEMLGLPRGARHKTADEWAKYLHPDDAERARRKFEGALAGTCEYEDEQRLIGADGVTRWVHVKGAVVRDPAGKPLRVIGVLADITRRRQDEQARAHLAAVVESSDDVIVSKTLDGVIQSWNAGAQRVFGYTAEETVGRPVLMLLPPERHGEEATILARLRAGERIEHFESVRITKDGRRIDVSLTISPIRDAEGRIIGASKIARDITPQKAAERELQAAKDAAEASLARWQAVVAAMSEGVVLADGAGNLIEWNAAALEMHGFTTVDEVRRPLRAFQEMVELVDAAGRVMPIAEWPMSRVLRGETFAAFEVEVRRKDRELHRVIRYAGSPVLDREGRVTLAVLTLHDVTEEQRAEAALRESEERLRLGLAAGDTGTWDWDIVHDRVTWSERVYQLHGLRSGEFGGRVEDFTRVIHPDDAAWVRAAIERSVREGTPYKVEFRVIHPDGGVHWIATNGKVYYAPDGRPVRMLGATTDVTDRKRAEAEHERLLASERVARAEAETMAGVGQALAAELDVHKLVQIATDAATNMTGAQFGAFFYNVVDEKGESYSLYTISGVPRDRFERFPMPRNTDIFAPTFAGAGVVRLDDVTADPRFGRSAPHHGMPPGHLPVRGYLAVPVLSRGGTVLGGLFFGHERVGVFTERHERLAVGIAAQAAVAIDNAQLFEAARRANVEKDRLLDSERAARAEAERQGRLKDEFVSTLSHELRTPLNAILGYAQLMRSDPSLSDDTVEGLAVIERNARIQTQIVEDILDVSRLISGKMRLDIQPVDVSAVIAAALETCKPAADAKGIRLVRLLDPQAGPVHGDPARLQQCIWNLVSNSIKFTPRGGRVQVVLQRVNSHVEIAVNDTGSGIKPEFLPHVFDRFRQQDASTTRRTGGLGLGLSIVKSLVELHGGSVGAKSEGEGRGATFTISLPLAPVHVQGHDPQRQHPRTPREAPAYRRTSLKGVRVLAVDDEPDARELVRRLLEDCGASVVTAASAEEALAAFNADGGIDLLISDIGMPGVDGYELIRQVRQRGPQRGGDVPAVALTAYARSEDRTRAMLAGFFGHVAKPVEPAELIATVAALARRIR